MKLFWMLVWEFFFVVFILSWVWFPMVLGLWEDEEPRWVRWVMDQAIGNF